MLKERRSQRDLTASDRHVASNGLSGPACSRYGTDREGRKVVASTVRRIVVDDSDSNADVAQVKPLRYL